MLTPLTDDEPEAWIRRETSSTSGGGTLASIVPPIFPAYAWIAHSIHLAPGLRTLSQVRFDGPSSARETVDRVLGDLGARLPPGVRASRARMGGQITSRSGQVRIAWHDLAAHLGNDTRGPMSFSSLWDLLPGDWPDDFSGPTEGSLTIDECRVLIDVLQPYTLRSVTYFYGWANSEGWIGCCDTGTLADVLEYFEREDVFGTPEYWWPADRSWVVSTDVDSCFTIVGGPDALVRSLLAHPDIEGYRVSPTDPIP